jgi:hypothetical protein
VNVVAVGVDSDVDNVVYVGVDNDEHRQKMMVNLQLGQKRAVGLDSTDWL